MGKSLLVFFAYSWGLRNRVRVLMCVCECGAQLEGGNWVNPIIIAMLSVL